MEYFLQEFWNDIKFIIFYHESKPLGTIPDILLTTTPFKIIVLLLISLFCAIIVMAVVVAMQYAVARSIQAAAKTYGWNSTSSKIFEISILMLIPLACLFPLVRITRFALENDRQFDGYFTGLVDLLVSYPFITCMICVVFGMAAYQLRCRARLAYAVLELAVGAMASFSSTGFQDSVGAIQFLGGIYIIVRALDNANAGLKEYPLLHRKWKIIFGKDA